MRGAADGGHRRSHAVYWDSCSASTVHSISPSCARSSPRRADTVTAPNKALNLGRPA
jgi:hypothetical protein